MAEKVAFMSVKTQYENLGDAFIIASLLNLMSQRAKTVIDVSRCPDSFVQSIKSTRSGDLSFLRFKGASLIFFCTLFLNRLKGNDVYYFMVPGGFSGDKNFKGYVFGNIYNILLGLMKICGIKAVQVGMSYDSLGPRYLSVLKNRAKLFYRHSPRDSISANYLLKKKLRHDEVIPDLAFNSLPIESELEVKASEKETVFFSFRVDSTSINKPLIEKCIQQIIFSFDSQTKFIFVSQVERDNDFARECYERYNKQGIHCELLINNTNIVSLLSRYQECSHVFSNRLHCLLLAARFGAFTVPVLSTDANLKIQGIWKDIGHSENIYFLNSEKQDTSLASVINNSQINFHKHSQSLTASFDKIFN